MTIDFGCTTPDEVLSIVADAECELYHLAADNPGREDLQQAAAAARLALEIYARAIGRYQEPPRLY